jgi:uridine kinase
LSVLIGVSGGSGSGKTTFAKALQSALGAERASIITQDAYYFDQSHLFDRDGGVVNFDHPDSLDAELLEEHLRSLSQGHDVRVPVYDFKTHRRLSASRAVPATELVIVDGILIFHWLAVRSLFRHRVFVDTPEEVRFARRLRRDVRERGRTPEGVHDQFYNQVKPMHDLFVEPGREHAHLRVSGEAAIDESVRRFCHGYLPGVTTSVASISLG